MTRTKTEKKIARKKADIRDLQNKLYNWADINTPQDNLYIESKIESLRSQVKNLESER